jgi:hypothetical protein
VLQNCLKSAILENAYATILALVILLFVFPPVTIFAWINLEIAKADPIAWIKRNNVGFWDDEYGDFEVNYIFIIYGVYDYALFNSWSVL